MRCKNCEKSTVGNSKYCAAHKKIAFEKWMQMITTEQAEKVERERMYDVIYQSAINKAQSAGENQIPMPMIVEQRANMSDDESPVVKSWFVAEGLCGFAWITVNPGNCQFANWLKKRGEKCSDYYKGVMLYVHGFNQSYERKRTYARVLADELESGLKTAGLWDAKMSIRVYDRLD